MVHERLRRAREAKGVSLAELGNRIGVRAAVLAAIERGAFAELPSGLYGRHAVRAYATAVGLNADGVLDEVGTLLPKPEDPLDGLARVRGFGRRPRRRESEEASAESGGRAPGTFLHEALAFNLHPLNPARTSDCSNVTEFDWRPSAASAIDGAVLAGVVLALAKLTAVAAGTAVSDVIGLALPAWALIAALIGATYFVLLGGVRNATLGATAVGVRLEESPSTPLDGRCAVRRGLQCALRESSIVVDWLLANRVHGGGGVHGVSLHGGTGERRRTEIAVP